MIDSHHLLHLYGPWAVFLLVVLESLGLPLPGETVLVAAAVFAGRSNAVSIWEIIALATAGTIVGGGAGFWIGRQYGLRLLVRYGARIGLDEPRLKLGQYLFQRFGGPIVFFGRFVAFLRAFAAVLAGANNLAPARFFVFNAAGGLLWATIFGLGGYMLGENFHKVAGPVGLSILVVVAVGIFFAWRFYRKHETLLLQEAEAALPGPLLASGQPG